MWARTTSGSASQPGITAASAAAASLDISLTLRGVARRLTFVTAHARKGEPLELDWQQLADPQATLAIYMGKAAARTVSARLIAAGLAPDTPVVLVECASLPEERHFATRLDLLPLAARTALGGGPAMILVGQALAAAAASASALPIGARADYSLGHANSAQLMGSAAVGDGDRGLRGGLADARRGLGHAQDDAVRAGDAIEGSAQAAPAGG